MQVNDFQGLLSLIASVFRAIFDRLDHFYLVGTFSIIDALIAFIIIDIVITALFVTFNVHVGSEEYTDKKGNTKVRYSTDISTR